ncbi:carboxymuconolactone decarboxylase family protein [Hydrogenophaga sp.]|uniref:carboxymuconolactone decarboxylase family protein n=1 Tax=Hydrogenophaga sp. TaxID=1904254 RepID=UPI0027255FB5|nr:carboxymuconolactone decarboxylase family protein [Hydrogenophaga sp.]MDO8904430.1 carboxymuconolactone decarboxylase family protein [Hydrogenophaga sp.]
MNDGDRIVPFQPLDLAEPADLVTAIRERRGGQLLNLDRMLLHSAPLATGWNGFLKQVREHMSLDPQLRELAMCGVAVLNAAEYEFTQHAPVFLQAGGTQPQLDALRLLGTERFDQGAFSALQGDAAILTLQMTRHIRVEDAIMRRLQVALGNQALVELVGTVAAYNMVSRFLVALHVTPE